MATSKKKTSKRPASKKKKKARGSGAPYEAEKSADAEAEVDAEKRADDFHGRTSVSPMVTAGAGGTAIFGGFIVEREKNTDVAGLKKYTTYSELLANVAIVAASVRYLFNLIGKAQWTVEPAKDAPSSARADDVAEQVDSIIHDMTTPWHRVVRRGATYLTHGYSWQEWTAKLRDDGAIGFLDIEVRMQKTIERWDCDESGTTLGVMQRSPQDQRERYLPRTKSIYVVDDTFTDSPEGLGILRHVAPKAKRLQRYEQLEGFGFETDLRGVPVGRAPYALLQNLVDKGKMSPADKAEAVQFLEDFIANHVKSEATGIVLDSMVYTGVDEARTPSSTHQWGVDLLKSSNTSQDAIGAAINRLIWEVALLFGTEGILLGKDGSGSLAMARDKSNSFGLVVDGALVEMALQFEKDVVETLGLLNGWDKLLLPSLRPEKLQHRDLREIAETLESLSRAGAPLDPADEAVNVVRGMMGLPEADVVEIVVDSVIPRGAGGGEGGGNEPVPNDPEKGEATPEANAGGVPQGEGE